MSEPTPYPSRIVVFCDNCGTEAGHDYVVHDLMTRDQRLGLARDYLSRNERWSCTSAGDFCPGCRLRGLSVRQPYAGAIMWLGKPVENRSRPMSYRGLLCIHASKPVPAQADYMAVDAMNGTPPAWTTVMLTRGAVLGTVEVTGCHHADDCLTNGRHCSPWAASRQFHIELRNARPLAEAVPCRGSLAMPWRLPDGVQSAVRAQLEVSRA